MDQRPPLAQLAQGVQPGLLQRLQLLLELALRTGLRHGLTQPPARLKGVFPDARVEVKGLLNVLGGRRGGGSHYC